MRVNRKKLLITSFIIIIVLVGGVVLTLLCKASSSANVKLLFETPFLPAAPNWSPDGTEIAFSDDSQKNKIVIISSDGKRFRTIASPGSNVPYWSPDGRKIAYYSLKNGQCNIWTIDSDGSNPTQLTTDGGYFLFSNPWSPQGDKLVFHSRRTGNVNVWIMDADGENQRQLVNNGEDIITFYPCWSPDGKLIALIAISRNESSILLVDVDGIVRKVLLSVPLETAKLISIGWSPTGENIAYTLKEGSSYGLWIIDINGTNRRRILKSEYQMSAISWSPDGTKIAFDQAETQNLKSFPFPIGIWVIDVDGSNLVRLSPDNVISYGTASWSPDGTKVVFIGIRATRDGKIGPGSGIWLASVK